MGLGEKAVGAAQRMVQGVGPDAAPTPVLAWHGYCVLVLLRVHREEEEKEEYRYDDDYGKDYYPHQRDEFLGHLRYLLSK